MSQKNSPDNEEKDVRVRMTSTIWGLSTGMLGICIPLTAITHSGPILPLFVILGATASSIAIWMRDANSANSGAGNSAGNNLGAAKSSDKLSPAEKRVLELEERLANLEAITNFEHKLLDKKYPDAAPIPAAPAFSFETPVSPPMPVDSGSDEMRRGASRPIAS